MQIAQIPAAARSAAIKTSATSTSLRAEGADMAWKNPVAASALRSAVQMLATVEDGMLRGFSDMVLSGALHGASAIIANASDAIVNDGNKDNDLFLPQISLAGESVTNAEEAVNRSLGDLPLSERAEMLGNVRTARVLSANVADQLDPNGSGKWFRSATELGKA